MFLRLDLVSPVYRELPPLAANNFDEFFRAGRSQDWWGYIGSPRPANAGYGAQLQQYRAALSRALAFAIIDGLLDECGIPRYANLLLGNKTIAKEEEGSTKHDAEVERKQREWMKKKGIQ